MKHVSAVVLACAVTMASGVVNAGFFSTFFGNLASDAVKNKSRDSLIGEKKIQGALGVMGFYDKSPDGDLNSIESRIAIKKYQESLGLDRTGLLTPEQKENLTYLSNLYTKLRMNDSAQEKKNVIYDEIDETVDSMRSKSFFDKFAFFSPEKVRIVSGAEDAVVYVDGEKQSIISLGYATLFLDAGVHELRIEKSTKDNRFECIETKEINVVEDGKNIFVIEPLRKPTSSYDKQLKEEMEKVSKFGYEYSPMRNGVIVDYETGLEWMRCSLGQEWNGYVCEEEGNPGVFDNKRIEAEISKLNRGVDGKKWRLPTISELATLVYCGVKAHHAEKQCRNETHRPTISHAYFPDTYEANYLSASTYVERKNMYETWTKHYYINFGNGERMALMYDKNRKVRLVRDSSVQ